MSTAPTHKITRRRLLQAGAALASGAVLPRPSAAQQRIILNDASRLNPTPVFQHRILERETRPRLIEQLRRELKDAAAAGRPIAGGAARHSLGGQSLIRDGNAITYGNGGCEPDTAAGTYLVQAGTRWKEVIATLDPIGFSPAVMQSNNDFGVASTFCVNAHGWPVPYGPFGSTVRRISLMLADGSIVTCSRDLHPELFGLAMGGYGLFGVILDLEVEMVKNQYLTPTFEVLPAERFASRMIAQIEGDPAVSMAYGRLSVARKGFFEEALLATYRPAPVPAEGLPAADDGGVISFLSRKIYRAQVGSESAKRARWFAETVAGPKAGSSPVTRNSLLNEPVSNLAGNDAGRTDVLHEYFVPPARFQDFVVACQDIIPRFGLEFMNVTLRYVAADRESTLAFAPTPRIAAVMSFSQEVAPEAEGTMLRMTEALIDRMRDLGGSFYLPYRLHARRDQVERIYPALEHFVDRKRHYDPDLRFQNTMWRTYFA